MVMVVALLPSFTGMNEALNLVTLVHGRYHFSSVIFGVCPLGYSSTVILSNYHAQSGRRPRMWKNLSAFNVSKKDKPWTKSHILVDVDVSNVTSSLRRWRRGGERAGWLVGTWRAHDPPYLGWVRLRFRGLGRTLADKQLRHHNSLWKTAT